MEQLVFFPLPLWAHIVFVVISIAVLAVGYYMHRGIYRIMLGADIAGTLLVYVFSGKYAVAVLGVAEIIIFVFSMVMKHIEEKEAEKIAKGVHFAPRR